MEDDNCKNCRFYISENDMTGTCFRFPPAASGDKMGRFPRVMGKRWCAEHQKKEENNAR